jgi:hypothetical protein
MVDFKETINAALAQLDHDNPDHWTDDGLPRTTVVQKLADNPTLRRADIHDALPGFVRKVAVTEPTPAPPAAAVDAGPTTLDAGEEESDKPRLPTEAEYRAMLDQDVRDAEFALVENNKDLAACHARVQPLRLAIEKAKQARTAAFPPLTVAQNIKMHLASEQQKRIDSARMSQVDMAMARGGDINVNYKRPVRAVVGVDGAMVMPVSKASAQRTFLPRKAG